MNHNPHHSTRITRHSTFRRRGHTVLPLLLLVALILPAGCRPADHAHDADATPQHAHQQHTPSPYAGNVDRPIKALSATDIDGYLSGAGMGLARAAELNSYPGPRHVLDLDSALGLSPDQRAQTEAIRAAMAQEAMQLGEQIVAAEERLDRLFAEAGADSATVASLLVRIGRLNGQLRNVHIQAHLQMRTVLSPEQIERYNVLRGYHADTPQH